MQCSDRQPLPSILVATISNCHAAYIPLGVLVNARIKKGNAAKVTDVTYSNIILFLRRDTTVCPQIFQDIFIP